MFMTGVLCTVRGAHVYFNVCPLDYTTVAGSGKRRITTPVG